MFLGRDYYAYALGTVRSYHLGMMQKYEQLVSCVISRILAKLNAGLRESTLNPVASGNDPFSFLFFLS